MQRRKKDAPYQTSLSAVKNTHKEKRGTEARRDKIPTIAASLGFDL